ncbi:WD40 repeat protein [Nonomuraea fuscirosea]|uniref:WD40 repeat protein n=1 Tax=Nonomuraea fuscirosea TaxID=1291556 RepID=A0A2T0M5G5_9ACTN|nr:trypsin-like peptidase domain-containing protein [Nonomuraea fuscirosea]PRX52694.1 WD40 repeat protein [Nonomuraea fuscirosea]
MRPERGIVEILSRHDDTPVGLGFLAGDRQVLTCAHVVNSALGRAEQDSSRPDKRVLLRYPFADGEAVRFAHVTAWHPERGGRFEYTDVCGLTLAEAMPGGAGPMTLADEGDDAEEVQAWGPSPNRPTNGHVSGRLMGLVDAARYQVDQEIRGVFAIRPGFSGGPVWSRATGQVLGMLQAVGREDVYVLSPAVLVAAWPEVLFRPPPCPYKGLRAFGEEDRELFFGRRRFVEELVDDAMRLPLVVVMGPSGSGKSSVIEAGLVPRLKDQGGITAVTMTPGEQPMRALARAFASSSSPLAEWERLLGSGGLRRCGRRLIEDLGLERLVVVMDQGEQLITHARARDRHVYEQFLNLLAELVTEAGDGGRPDLVVAMSIRDDFFGQLITSHRDLGPYLQHHARTLHSMSDAELREAITGPVAPPITIRRSLVDRLCADFRGRPAELPLLQFAMTQMWEQQRDRELSLESYERIGGIRALTRYADDRVELLPPTERAAARRILTSLVLPGTPDVARSASWSELRPGDRPVVRLLEKDRLVVISHRDLAGEPTVQVTHEALLRDWGRLRDWLEQDSDLREWKHNTALAKQAWLDTGQDPSMLLRGPVLARAGEMIASYPDDVGPLRAFIDESLSRQRAEEERARRLVRLTEALQLAARANVARTSVDGLLLGMCSLRRMITPEGQQALQERISGSRVLLAQLSHPAGVRSLACAPDGTMLATCGKDGTIRVWDVATRRELHAFEHHGVRALALSPDGVHLAGAGSDKTVRVWDSTTGRELHHLTHDDAVWTIAYAPDGESLVTGGADGTLRIWHLTSRRVTRHFSHRAVRTVAYSSDGAWVASGGEDGQARVWSVAGTRLIHRFGHDDAVSAVAFAPDGNSLATACADGTALVWDLETERVTHRYPHDAAVLSVAYSPDGETLAAAGADRRIRVWQLATGRELHRLTHDTVRTVRWSLDGARLTSGGDDGRVRVWDLSVQQVSRSFTHVGVRAVAAAPERACVATAGADGTARQWDLLTGKEIGSFAHRSVRAVSYAPGGSHLATGGDDRTVRVWDLETKREVTRLTHNHPVWVLAYSPDGSYLASGSADRIVRVWDVAAQQVRHHFSHGSVWALAWATDGKSLAAAGDRQGVRLWDLATGDVGHRFAHWPPMRAMAFAPHGTRLATASPDGTVGIWDLTTEQQILRLSHDGQVRVLTYSPDGTLLAGGGDKRTVHVWDLATGHEMHRFEHDGAVRALTFTPDGARLVSCGEDNLVKVWEVSAEALVEQARARLTRNLTEEEWRRYMPGEPYRQFRDDLT